jgi:hypothetical protein
MWRGMKLSPPVLRTGVAVLVIKPSGAVGRAARRDNRAATARSPLQS